MPLLLKDWILFLIYIGLALTALFVCDVHAEEPLVEDSIAYNYKVGSNAKLFNDLGNYRKGFSPCLNLEIDTLRWCSVHAVKRVLKEVPMDDMDRAAFSGALKTKDPCPVISIYIGNVCQHENFLKIIRHFTNRK